MLKLKLSNTTRMATATTHLENDLTMLAKAVNDDAVGDIAFSPPTELAEVLTNVATQIEKELASQPNATKPVKKAARYLRLYVTLMRDYCDLFYPHHNLDNLNNALEEVSSKIGKTPNAFIEPKLPHPAYLPADIEASKQRWKTQACPNPTRGPSVKKNQIHFLRRDSKSAVRFALLMPARMTP